MICYYFDMTIDEIRRAVALARHYDLQAKRNKAQIENIVHNNKLYDLDWLVDLEMSANGMYFSIEIANAIRESIRAAIG